MLLNGHNLVHYLLHKGLVQLPDCVAGRFSVRENSSRNTNFMVNREYPPGYLVKQAKRWKPDQIETVQTEAACYWLVKERKAFQGLRPYLPEFYTFDFLHHILITELLPNTQSLMDYYLESKRSPIAIGETIADILAAYHRIPKEEVTRGEQASFFKKRIPWVFTFADTPLQEWMQRLPKPSEQQSMQLIYQSPEFIQLIRAQQSEWQPTTLIHGDLRFNNFLIQEGYPETAPFGLKLIDWELADLGDPLWDVASVLQSYITLWVISEIGGTNDQTKTIDLDHFKPTIKAFWNRYVAQMNWDGIQERKELLKTIGFCAMRLINSCFEATPHVDNLQPFSAQTLQISLNLLRWPEEGAQAMLGLDVFNYEESGTKNRV
jgi:hypothetical protein